ncbi:MAG: FAD-dependent oxidoreductase, partial [bacterium]|nr:FAD-dependent oxidoreductase [bacterium]
MSEKEKNQNRSGVTRRDFFKSAGVVAGGTALGVGALPVIPGNMLVKQAGAVQADAAKKSKFEIPPAPISDNDIKEVVDTDIVVLGAGIGGMCAAISAAESGAKVVMLEKKKAFTGNGGWNGAIGSRLQKKMGIHIDRDEIVAEFMRWSAFKADQNIITLWADNSGKAMDWILDMTDAAGIVSAIESDLRKGGAYHHYETGHIFMNQDEKIPPGNHFLLPVLEANAKNKGVDIRYKTPAQQLVRNENGRVTGVIAKTKAGYIQCNAKKAVILATGGFQNNPEMLAKYIPDAKDASMIWTFPPKCTGDGHQMAMWIGAEMEAPEYHCPMYFDGGIPMAGM